MRIRRESTGFKLNHDPRNPVLVDDNSDLIAGLRRITAAKQLGWTEIPVHVATDLDDAIKRLCAERDENVCRLGFSISEAVSVGLAIEKLQRPPGRPPKGGNLPPLSDVGKTRDKVGEAIGLSGRTYEKAKTVIASGGTLTLDDVDPPPGMAPE